MVRAPSSAPDLKIKMSLFELIFGCGNWALGQRAIDDGWTNCVQWDVGVELFIGSASELRGRFETVGSDLPVNQKIVRHVPYIMCRHKSWSHP